MGNIYHFAVKKQSIGFQWNDMGFHMVNDMFFCFSVFFSNPVARIFDGLFLGGIQNRFLLERVFWMSGMFFL